MKLSAIKAIVEQTGADDTICFDLGSESSFVTNKADVLYPDDDSIAEIVILHSADATIYIEAEKVQAIRIPQKDRGSGRASRRGL